MIVFNCTFGGQAPKEFCPSIRIGDEIWQFIGLLILSIYLFIVAYRTCCFCIKFTESSPTLEDNPQINPPVIEIVQDPFIAIFQNLHNGVLQNSHQFSFLRSG